MLAPELKRTNKIDLKWPVRKFIDTNFGKTAVQEHQSAIEDVQQLREDIRQLKDSSDRHLQLLLKYLGIVNSMQFRFPIGETNLRIQYQWYNSFNKKKISAYDINLEKSSILFNIGAIYCAKGRNQNLESEEGLKQANIFFKLAAGAFADLKNTLQKSTHSTYTVDLTIASATLLFNLALAQAQECFFYKALKKSMKPKIVSMLGAATADYYNICVETAKSSSSLKSDLPKKWYTQIKIKKDLLTALSSLQTAKFEAEQTKHGIAIARLQLARQLLEKHKKDIKLVGKEFQEQYHKCVKDVETSIVPLLKENNTIYYQSIPSPATLPELPKKSMVKPSELDPNLTKLGPSNDPFAKLIPFAIHEQVVAYNEKKQTFVANELKLFEQANETLKSSLQSMGLPGSLEALEKPKEGLPPSLQEKVRVIQQEGGEKHILELLAAKANLARQNAKFIEDAEKILNEEEADDNQLRKQYGSAWNRTPSHTLTGNHRQEAAKFKANLQHALKSDAIVENKFKGIQIELRKMGGSIQQVLSLLPKAPVQQSNPANSKYVPELRKCINAIDRIVATRMQLQQNIRDMANDDDITNELMASVKAPEVIYEEQLKKYESIQQSIRDNIEKQRKQLEVTKKLNDAWTKTKNIDQTAKLREQALQRLDFVYQQYLQLKANLREGIQFYTNIQEVIIKFKRKCEDLVFARQTEKRELLNHISRNQQHQQQYQSQQPQQPYRQQPQQQSRPNNQSLQPPNQSFYSQQYQSSTQQNHYPTHQKQQQQPHQYPPQQQYHPQAYNPNQPQQYPTHQQQQQQQQQQTNAYQQYPPNNQQFQSNPYPGQYQNNQNNQNYRGY